MFSTALMYVLSSFFGTASHFFRAMMQARPSSAIRSWEMVSGKKKLEKYFLYVCMYVCIHTYNTTQRILIGYNNFELLAVLQLFNETCFYRINSISQSNRPVKLQLFLL